jgi:putative acetyltransferase
VAEFRAVSPRDSAAVREVNQAVLGRPDEAALPDVLRDVRAPFVSMVAAEGGTVVGHILFGRVSVEPEPPNEFRAVGLGPPAVLPARQRRGAGTDPVENAIEERRRCGYDAAFVGALNGTRGAVRYRLELTRYGPSGCSRGA